MPLTLKQQAELSENPSFKKQVRIAVTTVAHDVWFSIQRAPQGVTVPNPNFDDQLPEDPETNPARIPPSSGNMTDMDVSMFNYATTLINSPRDYEERFAVSVVQDNAVKNGFNDTDSVLIDANLSNILLSVVTALFPRFARVSRFQSENNA